MFDALYHAFRPILFRMDSERAHDLGLSVAQRLASSRSLARAVRRLSRVEDDPVEIAGLRFSNRIGLAAGMDKNAVAPLAWWAFGFGFVELGTVTPLPQLGNPKPRMYRYPKDHAIVNRMGFNNLGASAMADLLQLQRRESRRPPIPVGVSVGKNKDTAEVDTADDYARAAGIVAAEADFISINVSSPNTLGVRELQTPEWMVRLIQATRAESAGKPIFVKLAPDLDSRTLAEILEIVLSSGAVGVIASNTLKVGVDSGREAGGLSGRPLQAKSCQRVAEIRALVGNRLAIIGCGGVEDPASARRLRSAGADLIQLYTGLVYKGPFLPARLSRTLKMQSKTR